MKLSEAKVKEWAEALRSLELMGEDETIIEHTNGDCWEFFSQTRGNIFFTEKSMIFIGGLLGSTCYVYPYDKITEVKKCNVGGLIKIIPTGIRVTYENEKGKIKKSRLSTFKRKDWIEYINGKVSGLN